MRSRWATVNIGRVSHDARCHATEIVGEDRSNLPRTGLAVGRGGQEDRPPRPAYVPLCVPDIAARFVSSYLLSYLAYTEFGQI